MKTIKDIYNMIDYEFCKVGLCSFYGELSCGFCPKYDKWCHIDSYILAMDYLSKGVYYG